MTRMTISLDDALADEFTAWAERRGYENRSEAIRDLLRDRLAAESLDQKQMPHCVASVVYVYDHHERELGRRLTQKQHQRHDLTVASLHVHLDESQCLEVAVLRGAGGSVATQAQALVAERGVHHGNIHLIPTASHPQPPRHRHSHD